MSQLVNLTEGTTGDYHLPETTCEYYKPIAEIEGICTISPNQRLVSIVGGCSNPGNCPDRKRYLETIKVK